MVRVAHACRGPDLAAPSQRGRVRRGEGLGFRERGRERERERAREKETETERVKARRDRERERGNQKALDARLQEQGMPATHTASSQVGNV